MSHGQHASVTLVLGGVRSGKSRFAQKLASRIERVSFIATAEPRQDPEMHAKIERHRADRPSTWITIEEPLHLATLIREPRPDCDLLLIDCLTLFAANLLEACDGNAIEIQTRLELFFASLANAPVPVILVSNEVGSGVVPAYELGRRFRDLVGEINQRVAAISDTVLLMVAGLPFALKGVVPADVRQ